ENGRNDPEIVAALGADERFTFLKAMEASLTTKRQNFSTDVKSATFLKDALEASVRCKICDCHIHANAMTIDHIQEKRNAGTGSLDNAQVSHPYCNTTYKDLRANETETRQALNFNSSSH